MMKMSTYVAYCTMVGMIVGFFAGDSASGLVVRVMIIVAASILVNAMLPAKLKIVE